MAFVHFICVSLTAFVNVWKRACDLRQDQNKENINTGYSKVDVTESFDTNINNENTINHPLNEFRHLRGVKRSIVGLIKQIITDLNFSQCLYCCSVEVRPFLAGVARTFPMLEEIYQIYLSNYVHFQYIQSDIDTRVIQWCLYSLHFRDKSGFHCTRQHLRNYRQQKKIISQLCEIHRAWAITVLKTTVEIPLLNCDNAGSSHKKKPNYLLHVKRYHLLILCRVTASPISKKKYGLPSHQNKPPKATIKNNETQSRY